MLVLGMAYVGYFRQVEAGRARGIDETREAFFTSGDQTMKEIVKRLNAATATVLPGERMRLACWSSATRRDKLGSSDGGCAQSA